MTTKASEFKKELIDSILNEQRKFDMCDWKAGDLAKVATCKTALCMAGHIEALRPRLAKKLAADFTYPLGYNDEVEIDHELLAEAIWKQETGEQCRLDFTGRNNSTYLEELTRKDAVAHIRGRSKKWPLLPKSE